MEGRDQSCSYLLIAFLPRDCHFLCVKADSTSGTRETQSGNTGIFIPLPREDRRLYYSYFWYKEKLLSKLVIPRKEEMASHFNF